MKTVKLILSVIAIGIALSCSKSDDFVDEGYLKIDYKVDLGFFNDLVVNTDNNVYALTVVAGETDNMTLQKITPFGMKSELSRWDAYHFMYPLLSTNSQGKIYMSNNNLEGKIYSFTSEYVRQTEYIFDGAEQYNIRIDGFCSLPDNSFVTFDNNSKKIKRYDPSLNSESIIAGSGNPQITDGIGTNAGFSWFGKSVAHNNNLYVINDDHIRKIDCSTPNYSVSTPYIVYNEEISDIAVDSNEDIYALIRNKGIYKLSNGFVTVYKNGIENCRSINDNSLSTIDWKKFNQIEIKGTDLYLVDGNGSLIKISNFKTKL